MSDGCWVQFWDDEDCKGATKRFDAEGGSRFVNNLDDYLQSDGDKEGNEPDSLETGSRSWLVVYKDDNYEGDSASFGPNSQINDLDKYGVGGNISSFKLYDTRPSWFVDSAKGNPTTIETDDGIVNAQTVNNYFRTVVAAAFNLIPEVGGAIGTLIGGLWPDAKNRDQTWACYQNYLNQAIAGVYWQLTYESLNDILKSLYNAADSYVKTPNSDHEFKKQSFLNLYDLVNNTESFFVDESAPEKRYSFLAPYASLRLATLRENLQHYNYYYGSEPSDELRRMLTKEIQDSITLYQKLLSDARNRIVNTRKQQIVIESARSPYPYRVVDRYNGYAQGASSRDDATYIQEMYTDKVINQLAFTLDVHNTIGQLWVYFDPDRIVPDPLPLPTLSYAIGPFGWYQKVERFVQMTESGRVTEVALWTGDLVDSLELYIDGVGQGRVGGDGDGGYKALSLAQDERIVAANGYATGLINALGFTASNGKSIYGGKDGGYEKDRFDVQPLEGSVDTRLVGLTGFAGVKPGDPTNWDNLKAITFHWKCELSLDQVKGGAEG